MSAYNQELKDQALGKLKGNWGQSVGAVAIVMVVSFAFSFAESAFPHLATPITLLSILVNLPLQAGLYWAFLQLARGDNRVISNMFRIFSPHPSASDDGQGPSGFTRLFAPIGRVYGGLLLMLIFLILWMLPYLIGVAVVGEVYNPGVSALLVFVVIGLIVPVVIYVMAYFPVYFMVKDRPDVPFYRLPLASRRMMRGHKGQLFGLMMSFLGWVVLLIVVAIILGFVFGSLSDFDDNFGFSLLLVVYAGFCFLLPYMYATTAVWYDREFGTALPSQETPDAQ